MPYDAQLTRKPMNVPRAAQTVNIRLSKEQVKTVLEYLADTDDLSDNPRADIEDELDFIISEMIDNLRTKGGWWAR